MRSENLRVLQDLRTITRLAALIDLGPEGVKETQTLSEVARGLAARARGLRRMLTQGVDPVFRRLMKESGYLDGARKALREALSCQQRMAEVWGVYARAEGEFFQLLSRQAPEQFRSYQQVQKSEGV